MPEESVASWREVVVLVDLGEAVGKVVLLVVDRMGEGELNEVEFGEDFFHLGDDEVFEAVVVVDVEESSCEEVVAEVEGFVVGEEDVAVACEVEEGVGEDLGTTDIDDGVLWVEVHLEVVVTEGYEVGEGGGVGVPVASATIFE